MRISKFTLTLCGAVAVFVLILSSFPELPVQVATGAGIAVCVWSYRREIWR